ncbi:MAG: TetR family transcriptional regulator [Pseudonocardiaceae bacterium]|nr:MAG: TetR family transcriptional regulator [Pseudonocardiaceae bacterium]
MADAVKRSYRSTLREQQAHRTRGEIIDAARALFVAHGYAATSIDDIAEAAGVARRTVYAIGGKPELMKLAYETAIVGDHDDDTLNDRPIVDAIRAEPNPLVALHLYLDMSCGICERTAQVHAALRAASGDERVRVIFDGLQARRRDIAERLIVFFAGKGLRIARPDTAADVLWTLIDPGLYHSYRYDCGWSAEQVSEWVHHTVEQQLVAT